MLYVTAWDGLAYALETDTGDVLWGAQTNGMSLEQPAYADGYVVCPAPPNSFNGMLALDSATGEVAWTFEVADAEPDP